MTVDELIGLVQDLTKGMSVSDIRQGIDLKPVDELEPQSWGVLIRFLGGERPQAFPQHVLPQMPAAGVYGGDGQPHEPLAQRHLEPARLPSDSERQRLIEMEREWEARQDPLQLDGEFRGVELK